jgi:cyclopropane fatty-acyl-phospholipid synthase-like methyltransferase
MAQITSGFRSVLSNPNVYDFVQNVLGAGKLRKELVRKYVRPYDGMKILDIGCGTGEILEYLPAVEYLGVDLSETYIRSAVDRYGERGEFHVGRAESAPWPKDRSFDVVLSLGVLHHLGDGEVISFLDSIKSLMDRDTRIVTVDPCFDDEQSSIAKSLARLDRGQNVRTEGQYRSLFEKRFRSVKSAVRHDLLNIPYTHCILASCDAPEVLL